MYTTNDIIERIKDWGAFPISQSTFTNDRLVRFINDEMYSNIVPILVQVREEYLTAYDEYTLTGDMIQYFNIPTGAIGGMLRDIFIVNTTNSGDTSVINVGRADQNKTDYFRGMCFWLDGDKVVVNRAGDFNGYVIRLRYYKRPNQLVLNENACIITDITGNDITVDSVPATFTGTDEVDIINNKPPFNTLSTQTITFTGTVATVSDGSLFTVGNYVSLSGETIVPQLPAESHYMLAQGVVIKCLEAMERTDSAKMAAEKYIEMKNNLLTVLTPRVQGKPKRLMQRDWLL